MSKICVIIPVLNQHDLARQSLELLKEGLNNNDFEALIIDGGSDEEFHSDLPNVGVIRFDETIGVYPTFKIALENTNADILAFFHSDLLVENSRWYKQVQGAFKGDPKLGLIGFVGSSQWDVMGGRGGGTMLSFQGKMGGSPARDHGEDVTGQLRNAVVLDGCSMIFRRECLASLPLDEWTTPHHLYDRVLCAWTLERNWKIAVLGIECDHLSGRTANVEKKYGELGKKWSKENLGIDNPTEWLRLNWEWMNDLSNPSRYKKGEKLDEVTLENWDSVIYLESERRFLKEFRDKRKLIPRVI